jgi:adenylate cyclase
VKPTLGRLFGWSIIGLAAVLGLLFYIVFRGSRQTIMESSDRIRDGASRKIGERVASFLSKAPEAARQFQLELNRGLVDGRDPLAIESAQFGLLLSNRDISEVTFTYAVQTGFDANGNIQLAASPRGQISVIFRATPPFARPQQSTPLPFRARLSANCLAISQG